MKDTEFPREEALEIIKELYEALAQDEALAQADTAVADLNKRRVERADAFLRRWGKDPLERNSWT